MVAKGKRPVDAPASEAGPKKARGMTTDQVVAKKIADNFKGYDNTDIDVKVAAAPCGKMMTLRQRLNIEVALGKIKNFTPSYYSELRNTYRSRDSAHAALSPLNKELLCRPQLFKALTLACRHQADRSKLESWMLSAHEVEEHEVSAFFRYMIKLRCACKTQLKVALNGLRFCARLNLDVKFKVKFGVIKHWVDEIVCAALRRSRAQKVPDDKFMKMNSGIIALILDLEKVATVANCEGDYASVRRELVALVGSSSFALDIYEGPLSKIMASSVKDIMSAAIDALFKEKCVVTETMMRDSINTSVASCEAIPGVSSLPRRREISIEYFNLRPTIYVESMLDEAIQRHYAVAKAIAVQKKQLPGFWGEMIACDLNTKLPYEADVHKDLLLCQEAARLACKEAFDDGCVTTGDGAQQILNANLTDYLLTDESFKLEAAVSKLVSSEGSETTLKDAILKCLPSATSTVDLSTATQHITLLTRGQLYNFSSRSAQGKVNDVLSICSHLLEENAPPIKAEMVQCSFLKACLDAIAYFITYTKPAGSGEVSTPVRGVAALEELIIALTALETVTLGNVRDLHLYKHYVPADFVVRALALQLKSKADAGLAAAACMDKKHKAKVKASSTKLTKDPKKATKCPAAAAAQSLFD